MTVNCAVFPLRRFSRLPAASGILWRDGVNAGRSACDYRKENVSIRDNRITVHLAPGGACVLELYE